MLKERMLEASEKVQRLDPCFVRSRVPAALGSQPRIFHRLRFQGLGKELGGCYRLVLTYLICISV